MVGMAERAGGAVMDGLTDGLMDRLMEGVTGRVRDLARGLTTWPARSGWVESAAWAGALVALAAPLAWAGGLIEVAAGQPMASARTLLLPFVSPALIEESLFRGLLVPHPKRTGVPRVQRARWWAASLAAYLVAHPLLAATLRGNARGIFDTPVFLLEAGLLGVTATALYERTGSLWPAVLLHGAVVAAWLSFGGAALLAR